VRHILNILAAVLLAWTPAPCVAQSNNDVGDRPVDDQPVDGQSDIDENTEPNNGLFSDDDEQGEDDDSSLGEERDPFFDESSPRRSSENVEDKPLEAMTEAEMREAGYIFSDRDRSDLGSTGTVLALTVGAAVHGVGHLYVGDEATGLFLMAVEAASILALIGSGVTVVATGNADGTVAFSSSLFKLGVSGFFASWILDILGTLQGDTLTFPINRGPERGMHATIGYRLVDVDGTPMNHGFDADIAFDNDWVQVGAGTTQDVLLNLQQYSGRVGTRPLVGGSRLTWLGTDVQGAYTRYTGFGEFGQLDLDARLNFSVGMLAVSSSFDQISLGGSVGWGRRFLQTPNPENRLVFGDSRDRFLFDLHGELGVTERLSSRVGYRNADGILFPAESPFIGITYLDLVYRSAGFGDLILGAAFGNGVMLTAGGRMWLWR
jgi:hypothetical protein